MVGSSMSIAGPNLILNTIVAEALDEIATRIEKTKNINEETVQIIKDVMKEHGRIIFNGNNYSDEWLKEAEKRGLQNIKNTVDAHKNMITRKAENLFSKYKVLSKQELHSRFEIYIEQYSKQISIEAKTAIKMVKRQYLPAVIRYIDLLSDSIIKTKECDCSTSALLNLLNNDKRLEIITPPNRGTQLSIKIKSQNPKWIFEQLEPHGVIADWREPDVIRVAPAPLYNSYHDVWQFSEILKSLL
jgi:glutamine synthetase type III